MQDIISDNARRTQDQAIFRKRHAELMAEVEKRQAEADKAKTELLEATANNEKLTRFMTALRSCEDEAVIFTDELWVYTIDYVDVKKDKVLEFHFMNGEIINGKI